MITAVTPSPSLKWILMAPLTPCGTITSQALTAPGRLPSSTIRALTTAVDRRRSAPFVAVGGLDLRLRSVGGAVDAVVVIAHRFSGHDLHIDIAVAEGGGLYLDVAADIFAGEVERDGLRVGEAGKLRVDADGAGAVNGRRRVGIFVPRGSAIGRPPNVGAKLTVDGKLGRSDEY